MKCIVAAVAAVLAGTFAAPAHAEDAKALFAQKCAGCHGSDGKGQPAVGKKLGAKDLAGLKGSEADIAKMIEDGKPPKMLAYKGKLTPEQIQVVAAYVKAGLK